MFLGNILPECITSRNCERTKGTVESKARHAFLHTCFFTCTLFLLKTDTIYNASVYMLDLNISVGVFRKNIGLTKLLKKANTHISSVKKMLGSERV